MFLPAPPVRAFAPLVCLALSGLAPGACPSVQEESGTAAESEAAYRAEAWSALQPYWVAHQAGQDALAAGHLGVAERHFETALLNAGEDQGPALYGLACVASLQGRQELALSRFDMALEAGYWEPEMFAWDADIEGLRVLPGFNLRMEFLALELPEGRARTVQYRTSGRGSFIDARWLAGATVVAGDDAGYLWAFDGATGALLQRSTDLGAGVWALERMPANDGSEATEVVALLLNGDLVRWAPAQVEPLERVDGFPEREDPQTWHAIFGGALLWSSDGQRLAVAGANNSVQIFDADLRHVTAIPGPLDNSFMAHLAWDPAGQTLLSLSAGELRAHDRDGRSKALPFEPSSTGPTEEDVPLRITDVAFAPASERTGRGDLVAIGWNDARAHVHRWPTGERVASVYVEDLFSILDITTLEFSRDGSLLAAGTASSSIAEVIRLSDAERVATTGFIGGRMGEPLDFRFTPEGDALWLNYASGAMDLSRLDTRTDGAVSVPAGLRHYDWASSWSLQGNLRRSQHGPGRAPVFGPPGKAVTVWHRGLSVIDPHTGYRLWERSRLGDEHSLLHTSTGHFTGIPEVPPSLTFRGEESAGDFLSLAKRLHDPKRVQAAAAGVRLRGER